MTDPAAEPSAEPLSDAASETPIPPRPLTPATFASHRWLLFRRRMGNPLLLISIAAAAFVCDLLAARGRAGVLAGVDGVEGAPLPLLLLAMIALLAVAGGLAWRRLFALRDEAELLFRLGLDRRLLARQWLWELQWSLLPFALWAGVVLARLLEASSLRWPLAAACLLATPGLGALGARLALGAAALGGATRWLATMALFGAALAGASLTRGGLPGWAAPAAAAALSLVLPALARGALGASYRERLLALPARSDRHGGGGSGPLEWLTAPLPRATRALLLADLRFVMRGGHIRGKLLAPPLFLMPLLYLAWPLPPDVEQAPVLAMGMLSTFGLAALGYVFGGDLGLAERPYLPLRRLQPVRPVSIWMARLLLVMGIGALWGLVMAAMVLARFGAEGLPLLGPLAALVLVVPAYTAALGMGAADTRGASDMALASAVATSAAIVGLLTLLVAMIFPLALIGSPLLVRQSFRLFNRKYRREELL